MMANVPAHQPATRLAGALFLFLLAAFGPARAAVVTPNLPAGAEYRIAFVTSAGISASNTDINVYDSFVNGLANSPSSILAPLGATWKAIASTLAVDAFSHIGGAFTVPVYSVFGDLIAVDAADLWDGSLNSPIWIDENGVTKQGGINVNTGTLPDGSASPNPLGGDPVLEAITGGVAGATGTNWIVGSFEGKLSFRPVYGISDTLRVAPVPVPKVGLLLVAAVGLTGFMARAKRPSSSQLRGR